MAIQLQMSMYYHCYTNTGLPQDLLLTGNPICNDQSQKIITAHVLNQTMEEVDLFLTTQNEKFSTALQEQTRHQTAVLVTKYQSKVQSLITHNEDEIAKAVRRGMELREVLKRMEMEKQVWQKAAEENEAMAASMNGTIRRLREAAGDAESCCVQEKGDGDQSAAIMLSMRKKMTCKCCSVRKCCVVLLPCRHLCSCQDCEPLLDSCPVCKIVKKATVEAFL